MSCAKRGRAAFIMVSPHSPTLEKGGQTQRRYSIAMPPFTCKVAPVTQPASSLAR